MKSMRLVALLMIAVALGKCLLETSAAGETPTPYVVVGGNRISGSEVRADRNGNITLVTPGGLLTFDAGTVVVVDEPRAFPELRHRVEAGDHAGAVPGLREMIAEYRFLGWDHRARRYLARALTGLGQYAEAAATLEELFAAQSAARGESAVQETYMRALKGMGDREKLVPLLAEVIRAGDREAAAVAQMMRGNMHLEAGEEQLALYDLMRTAMLFRSAEHLQPEALYRTALCLERLGYADKADRFYLQLTEQYPDSDFAARVPRR